MPPATEIELKFLADAATEKRLRRRAAALCGGAGLRSRRVTTIYFDTPGHDLHAHGIALRLRRDGRRWQQTVKARTALLGGLQTAEESDAPAPGGRLNLDAIADPALARRIAGIVGDRPLGPVCETAIERAQLEIDQADGSRIAIMFDRGEIRAGDRAVAFREVEIELIAGSIGALFDVARTLLEGCPVRFSTLSKPERGFLLAREGRISPEPAPRTSRVVPLDPRQSAESAAQAILRECLGQVHHNAAVLVAGGDDPEAAHQLRVGLRRLRSAFVLFRRVIGHPEATRLAAEAKWLGQETGALRDAEVAIHEIVAPEAAAHPAEPGFGPLQEALARHHADCRDRLRATLAGARAQAVMLDLLRFVEARGWLQPDDIDQTARLAAPLRAVAGAALDRRWRAVERRARGIETLDVAARHDLRKQLKKLRYSVDFLGPIYRPKRVAAFSNRLKDLQAVFGVLNDLAMAEALFSAPGAPGTGHPAAQRAIGIVLGASFVRAEMHWGHARNMWRGLKGTRPFWG